MKGDMDLRFFSQVKHSHQVEGDASSWEFGDITPKRKD